MGRPAWAGIAWPAGPINIAACSTWNPSAHPPVLTARQATEDGWHGRRGQLSPLTVPPQIAVLIEMAYPSPLVRYQWSKVP
jgi:hypothetical protein